MNPEGLKEFFFSRLKSEDSVWNKKLPYYYLTWSLSFAAFAVFFYRFNFHHGVSQYNFAFAAAYVLLFISAYNLFCRKSYQVSANLVFAAMSLIAVLLIYDSGGLRAPGAFWLSALPLLGGFMTGRKGLILGLTVVISALAFYYIDYAYLNWPKFSYGTFNYNEEIITNLILFLGFMTFATYYYVHSEEQNIKQLVQHRDDIDVLLKILIHDIANPLSAAINRTTRLRRQSPPEFGPSIERISFMLERINEILVSVRELKLLNDGKMNIVLKKANISSCVQKSLQNISDMLTEKNINVDVTDIEQQCFLLTDPQILTTQVLTNFLTNAVKFSEKGSTLKIGLKREDGFYNLVIEDRGVGIDQARLDTLFNSNKIQSTTGTLGEKGVGYGLPLAKSFVERLGGDLQIKSKVKTDKNEDHGTTVTIKFAA
ncbi:MAG: HAMP domain-containing sensor histidine kinase [Bdellovibrionales bacterium]